LPLQNCKTEGIAEKGGIRRHKSTHKALLKKLRLCYFFDWFPDALALSKGFVLAAIVSTHTKTTPYKLFNQQRKILLPLYT
jgi:hypothetical protein